MATASIWSFALVLKKRVGQISRLVRAGLLFSPTLCKLVFTIKFYPRWLRHISLSPTTQQLVPAIFRKKFKVWLLSRQMIQAQNLFAFHPPREAKALVFASNKAWQLHAEEIVNGFLFRVLHRKQSESGWLCVAHTVLIYRKWIEEGAGFPSDDHYPTSLLLRWQMCSLKCVQKKCTQTNLFNVSLHSFP